MRPSTGVRLARTATGAVFVASLAVVVLVWITVSRPFDPHQRPPVPAVIDAATTRAAEKLPAYPGTVVALTYHAVSDDDHAGEHADPAPVRRAPGRAGGGSTTTRSA